MGILLNEGQIMKLCTFVSRLQELNAYPGEFSPDGPGDVPSALPREEVKEMIYQITVTPPSKKW